MNIKRFIIFTLAVVSLKAELTVVDLKTKKALYNKAAYVTTQCYTKTVDSAGDINNPCFSCHVNSIEPNYADDWRLQESYDMSSYTRTNRFTNLFKDRRALVDKISDREILQYIAEDNYKNSTGIILATKLKKPPKEWDVDSDGVWDGYLPDCLYSFDNEGFDRGDDLSYTGWRAFGYYPFLGTFWPTNGSTDDVLIRLPRVFREDLNGTFNKNIYILNLAIIESLIKQTDIAIDPTDERLFGVDLDQNGSLGIATTIKYRWRKPSYDIDNKKLYNFSMSYVGRAKQMLESGNINMAPGLYPKGTEFLHSVRYIDTQQEDIKMAKRMKELRYGIKTHWNSYAQIQNSTLLETKERDDFPDRLRDISGSSEEGLSTGLGWRYQGFIEDRDGELRPQSYEETLYCIGCHSGIGATTDSTFAFARKFDKDSFQNGWYHWLQDTNSLHNIKEPKSRDGAYEYTRYLQLNHAGDEFRANQEVKDKFFTNNTLRSDLAKRLHKDISILLYPSPSRALNLNKAYKVIVDEQSYIYGRDAHIEPLTNVHERLTPNQSTKITPVQY